MIPMETSQGHASRFPTVKTILAGGAAAEWNVKAHSGHICVGDQVLEVDGVSTVGATAEDMRQMLIGPVLSTVVLSFASTAGLRPFPPFIVLPLRTSVFESSSHADLARPILYRPEEQRHVPLVRGSLEEVERERRWARQRLRASNKQYQDEVSRVLVTLHECTCFDNLQLMYTCAHWTDGTATS